MATRLAYAVLAIALTGTLLTGCQTRSVPDPQPLDMVEVVPAPNQDILVDRLVILADASGSLSDPAGFRLEKALVESFVAGMPTGNYDVALRSFSGSDMSLWTWNPMLPFDRAALAEDAAYLEYIGETTRLDLALTQLKEDLAGSIGRGAILIFSDGKVRKDRYYDIPEIGAELVRAYGDRICVHTVQMGTHDEGSILLRTLSGLTACGGHRTHTQVSNVPGMEALIRHVFFGLDAPDSDGDGVCDAEDHCPNTPAGALVNSRGCWVVGSLNFDTDKSYIKREFSDDLAQVTRVLQANPGIRVRVDGHTDSVGSASYNVGLSGRRAAAVRRDLINRGINASRLETKGFGESQPIVDNSTPANRYMNRRVELTVIP
jgi:OOP family OmpA-OmpF porin